MKILNIQSYYHTSKLNSQQNQKSENNVSFMATAVQIDNLAAKIGNDYRFIQMAVQKRFAHNPDRKTITGPLDAYEIQIFQKLYSDFQEILKSAVVTERKTSIKKVFAGTDRSYRLESGPVFKIDGGASILRHLANPSEVKNCTSYTIICKDIELKNNFYRIVFDEKGIPRILTYIDKDGEEVRTFIPKI